MTSNQQRLSTGIDGLDTILDGGLIENRSYLVRGKPGTGKTTLGLHFLTEGASDDKQPLYINLGEEEETIYQMAETYGLDLSDFEFLDLAPTSEVFVDEGTYDIFTPAEVESGSFKERITEAVQDIQPERVFLDPVTQFRYLAPDEYQFHEQMLSFLQFLKDEGITILFTSQDTPEHPDDDFQFLSDGVIEFDRGDGGRTVEITKFRGSDFRGDTHTMKITGEGLEVYPRLVPERHERSFTNEKVSSGVPEVDRLLNGGLERGSVTFISGPSGVGKTTLGMQFMREAAGRGERSVAYLFEEMKETLITRSKAINIPVEDMIEQGALNLEEIESLEIDTNQFGHRIREEVEQEDASIVMIDGMEGYSLSVRGDDLISNLHALGRYLTNMGVTAIIVAETKQITGAFNPTEHGGTYLADNLIFLRHLEIGGEMRKSIGVLKKRMSDYERMLREFRITQYGIQVGEPLTEMRGILSGTPDFVGEEEKIRMNSLERSSHDD